MVFDSPTIGDRAEGIRDGEEGNSAEPVMSREIRPWGEFR